MNYQLSFIKIGVVFFVGFASLPCKCQREPSLPINSFNQLIRSTIPVPRGRSANFKDVLIRFYGMNSTTPSTYRMSNIKSLLLNKYFDVNKPTVVYAHGYVELSTDKSVMSVVRAYQQHGSFNVLVLDWANLAFGNYLLVAMDVPVIGKATASSLLSLLRRGLPVDKLHLVGHSLGAHLVAYAARGLDNKGYRIQRLTGLDPALPGFYPPLFGDPLSPSDAVFVDVVHTDGGGYGAMGATGHADYWPNGGRAKQPGCQPATVPFSDEDFCSHWRSWAFWAESVTGGEFLARQCDSYDSFIRGNCRGEPLVNMGLKATPDLRGNFYLRTGAKEPYALGELGAN